MKTIQELIGEEMFVLVAPDGSIQTATLAPDFVTCVAITQLLSDAGISQPLQEMFDKGFEILPVRVTITQNGKK